MRNVPCMNDMLQFYEKKLVSGGLTPKDAPILGFFDADIIWNRKNSVNDELLPFFENLNINSLLFSKPAEPYNSIINYLAQNTQNGTIFPKDCETKTFLHDIPISSSLLNLQTLSLLKERKSVIIPSSGIITYGTVSMEQAIVTYSSVCFACFVKFFSDFLSDAQNKRLTYEQKRVFKKAVSCLDILPEFNNSLVKGPFESEEIVILAMDEAGREVVEKRLVDSTFGNISCCFNDVLYISQTGSFLDNLKGFIDPCPLDKSSCASITASSELSTHMEIIRLTESTAILHGHPKFSVILSMDCKYSDECNSKDQCHRKCPYERDVCGVPVVSGEVGTGVFGLVNTVPPAMKNHKGVIVYGHGLFTRGEKDFNQPFSDLVKIENMCRIEYFNKIKQLTGL